MSKPKKGSKAKAEDLKSIRIPIDVYEDLARLQGVYPGRSVQRIAEDKLRAALKAEEDTLAKLREMEKAPPELD